MEKTDAKSAPGVPIQIGWKRGDASNAMLTREWLVTNALGGYASGTIGGANTRRFHGFLIAALPAPAGRTMMFNHLEETLEGPADLCWRLSGDEHGGRDVALPTEGTLEEFVIENGKPVWRFAKDGIRIEKRVLMPHLQNTAYIAYRLLEGPAGLRLRLRPSLHFRPHEGLLTSQLSDKWHVSIDDSGCEIELADGSEYPPLRLLVFGGQARMEQDVRTFEHVLYRIEKSRGYEDPGAALEPWCDPRRAHSRPGLRHRCVRRKLERRESAAVCRGALGGERARVAPADDLRADQPLWLVARPGGRPIRHQSGHTRCR